MKTLKELIEKVKTCWKFWQIKFWIICLFIGIYLILNGCGGSETGYIHRFEFVYINQTSYTLKFNVNIYGQDILVILPQSSSDTLKVEYEGGKEIAQEEYHQSYLDDLLLDGRKSSIVYINETFCVEFFETGFMKISNYQYKVVGKRHVKYTYTFSDADFADAKHCDDILNE